jgi:ABC-type cobalamin/Fe3+-siderophores transport system ATPase subunit
MLSVKVALTHCYGITSLQHTFDFSKRRQYVVYAPNGVMKSSLARTFKDVAEGRPSEDRIYVERETLRSVKDEHDQDLQPENVFVVEPYDESYRSNRMSTLLVNQRLRERYDAVRKTIDDKKAALVKLISSSAGLKRDTEEKLATDVMSDPKEFFRALGRLRAEVAEGEYTHLSEISYAQIFSDKVAEQLASPEFQNSISDYMETYDRLTENSTFFRKGIFNHNNAADVAKSLKANGFFEADHSVYVNNKDVRKEIKNEKDLEKVIEEEKEAILDNPSLKAQFDKIDKILTKNVDMKGFREYLSKNDKILPELSKPDRLRQRLWVAYLSTHESSFRDLMETYESGREELEAIVAAAKAEATRWVAVLREFNDRFSVPFIVTMENQDDVILKAEAPSVKFRFKGQGGDEVSVQEKDLLKVLSNGEKRALYILNVIFEVIARKDAGVETLFIFDDIADSFDYKNKYAIVEYLRDISETPGFYQLILTHNYDFFRTISGRLDLMRENKLHTIKKDEGVYLKQEKYQNTPFRHWKDKIPSGEHPDFLIAMIPFLRNIAEYTDRKGTEAELTRYLHVKAGSADLTVGDLEVHLKNLMEFAADFSLPEPGKKIFDLLFERADAACALNEEQIELESKIVLAIAVRIRSEQFMIGAIGDPNFVGNIKKNQTSVLIDKFKELFPTEENTLAILKQVNLMTPENIHLNSFMYEPILDMSNQHLKRLYAKVKALEQPEPVAA